MISYFQPVVYIQISPEQLTLRNLRTGESIVDVPEMAVAASPQPKILAVGTQAREAAALQAAQVLNPFAHPRSLVSDFTAAQLLLKHQLRRVVGRSLWAVSPYVVMHPLGSPLGGFTQVERRAFLELGHGAGAAVVHLWMGRPLTNEELLARKAPVSGGEWE